GGILGALDHRLDCCDALAAWRIAGPEIEHLEIDGRSRRGLRRGALSGASGERDAAGDEQPAVDAGAVFFAGWVSHRPLGVFAAGNLAYRRANEQRQAGLYLPEALARTARHRISPSAPNASRALSPSRMLCTPVTAPEETYCPALSGR